MLRWEMIKHGVSLADTIQQRIKDAMLMLWPHATTKGLDSSQHAMAIVRTLYRLSLLCLPLSPISVGMTPGNQLSIVVIITIADVELNRTFLFRRSLYKNSVIATGRKAPRYAWSSKNMTKS